MSDVEQLKRGVESICGTVTFAPVAKKAAAAYNGHLFISHTSADHEMIKHRLLPTIAKGTAGKFFIASKKSGQTYDALVFGALRGCKTVLVVVTEAATRSPWVGVECIWGVEQKHPIIACSLDGTCPSLLHRNLRRIGHQTLFPSIIQTIDFSGRLEHARSRLAGLLSKSMFAVGSWRSMPVGEAIVPGPEMVANLDAGDYLWNRLTREKWHE